MPMIINSVFNPVIYTVRKRQFRVVFIELHSRNSLQEAEQFDRRMIKKQYSETVNWTRKRRTGTESPE